MKIAIICSNLFNIDKTNKTGTGIFNDVLINNLVKLKNESCNIVVFASGESSLPAKIECVDFYPSAFDHNIVENSKHIMFELALISKAFVKQDKFDVFHVNIGDGDLILPFAAFVKKPILITLHHIINEDFTRKYFSLFKNIKNVYFISVSNYQRKLLPNLNYVETIYHGVNSDEFKFNSKGGENIMWAGRLIPNKGPDVVIKLAKKLKHPTKLFGVVKNEFVDWFKQNVESQIHGEKNTPSIAIHLNYERHRLIKHFQTSKLFLSPILYEESFGLVFIESMACGTPVVAFARGATTEIIQDGKTGFLVNPSDEDIRGNWIIKKTGFAGLCEAVEKIYSMQDDKYKIMRQACRDRTLQNFSVETMTKKYLTVYEKIIRKSL